MDRLRRFERELALESRRDERYRWLSLRRSTIRTGYVNPPSMEQAYDLHRLILELSPYHLTISPLDVDFLELLYGFDLECHGNHDQVVYDALLADTPLGRLGKAPNLPHAKIMDVQPIFGLSLSKPGDLQAYFEVKTRKRSRRGSGKRYAEEPISLFLTLRKYGPVKRIEDLKHVFEVLVDQIEVLATERFVPDLLTPIARQITNSSSG
jgi:hypothetical protein